MIDNGKLLIAKGEERVYLLPEMANRHGLIAGATGTGKTITLKVLAESFSDLGVPVFLADIKGDLSGMCRTGAMNEHLKKRLDKMEITDFPFHAYPTCFWDVFGKDGIPVRATISEMGPMLLSRLLDLSDAQEGVLNIVFRIADDRQMLLYDLKDLRSMLQYVGEHAKDFNSEYGAVSSQSVGAIQRSLLGLEDAGGDVFFGTPQLHVADWMRRDTEGKGTINVLNCVQLFQSPKLYSTFMLWLLSQLFEDLEEVGDLEKPKMVFFFDEAHLLFADAPKVLVEKVTQVVKLIRSKGIGIYFITQSPSDLPDPVLAQLGNRVQHALRAYTPAEQKAVKVAAQSFRENPSFKTVDAITELATGEALVSLLDEGGRPGVVQRATMLCPSSLMGPADPDRVRAVITSSDLYDKYHETLDPESAYEKITATREEEEKEAQAEAEAEAEEKERLAREKEKARQAKEKARPHKKTLVEKSLDTAMGTVSREVGKTIARGILGILKRK